MLSKFWSLGLKGINGFIVGVEVDIASGLPTYSVVGLPDAGIKESKDRVIAAIRNSGFDFPVKKITVNLSPAEIKKAGTHFDLPMALGILRACDKINKSADEKIKDTAFIGELALDGSLRPVSGVLPMTMALKNKNSKIKTIIVPASNSEEAAAAKVSAFKAKSIKDIVKFLNGEGELDVCRKTEKTEEVCDRGDFSEVKSQAFAKRALEIAAAGFHNVIMVGPPGSGKSMLSKRFPSILPSLDYEECLEVTKIYSVSGLIKSSKLMSLRPFRDPHHTISNAALIGGGSNPRPGEASLAHYGVLFLDEFSEFSRAAIESLREPLESKEIRVARVKESVVYPAKFILIAAMNPCPCGYLSHPTKECICTPPQVHKYRSKISGPILDRIDMHIQLSPIKYDEWASLPAAEKSSDIKERVLGAIDIQQKRFAGSKTSSNSFMSIGEMKKYCKIPESADKILETAMNKLGFSARSLDKILKVSRTIADLEGAEDLKKEHIMEAVQYRILDKTGDMALKY
ncbi:MAG: YifB family Mg chelatase-like AAA ATPase [Elusimicrobiota bacterium]|nr:YifB family Mg chelatase-like AAA ATPase [Elusimicrobiota bacterium]